MIIIHTQTVFGRDTANMIFEVRQLQEKCREQNVGLYTTFVDLTKAFDTVCREGLWKIMAKFGSPAKFIAIVRQFHDGMKARVQDGVEYSEPFLVTNGVKQGCVLAPTLFSMVFSVMLSDTSVTEISVSASDTILTAASSTSRPTGQDKST